jgi:hypothetical protein
VSTSSASILFGVLLVGCHAQQPVGSPVPVHDQPRSVLTPITQPPCTLVEEDEEGGDSTQECPGVAGYRLLLLDSDSRMSATVLGPGGWRADLNAWSIVTPSFSSIAGPAHWRILGPDSAPRPLGIVLRFNANEDPNKPDAITTYFAVVKLASDSACIVERVAGPDAEQRAVHAADHAGDKSCLESR